MPAIYRFGCNKCKFTLPSGWGGIMYVTDDAGKRIICPHPGEMYTVYSVIGQDASHEQYMERTGFNSDCFCMDCLSQFRLDLDRDERTCNKCGSINVVSTKESVGKPCPQCKKGVIRAVDTGIMC
jgi:hypothetical protein